jgi:hypothetical protein
MAIERVLQVMRHLRLVLVGLQAGLEPGGIQSHLGRIAFQIGLAQGWRPLIQSVVIFPELALIERTLAGFSGPRRFGDRVGEIAPDDLELVALLRAELLEDTSLVPRLALRSAKVAVFNQGDGRGGRSEGGIAGQARRAELGRGACPGPQVDGGDDGHQAQQSRADPLPT